MSTTKAPWTVTTSEHTGVSTLFCCEVPMAVCVPHCKPEYILTALNAHCDLFTALVACRAIIRGYLNTTPEERMAALNAADAAIQKAGEQ